MIENLMTLAMLVLLQAVLGFDNLLYISIESKRAPEADRSRVRTIGIGLAVGLRIALLFVLIQLIDSFKDPMFEVHTSFFEGAVSLHALIVLAGGGFIIYTATKEVFHMIAWEAAHEEKRPPGSVKSVVFKIVLMNLVFSFDSILSAMALTDVFWVMATAIVIGGLMMMLLADRISTFLQKNRMVEVLGLFILLIVGIMLVTEGGHLAHLKFFGHAVTPMTKTTFYFVLVVLVLTDFAQNRYQKRLQLAQDD